MSVRLALFDAPGGVVSDHLSARQNVDAEAERPQNTGRSGGEGQHQCQQGAEHDGVGNDDPPRSCHGLVNVEVVQLAFELLRRQSESFRSLAARRWPV